MDDILQDGFTMTLVDWWAVFLAQKAQSLLPRLKRDNEYKGEYYWIDREFKKMSRWPDHYQPPIHSSTYRDFEGNFYFHAIN